LRRSLGALHIVAMPLAAAFVAYFVYQASLS
jgi:hypothetical protein